MMKDILDSKLVWGMSARHLVLIIGGLMLAGSVFLTWATYMDYGERKVLNGVELQEDLHLSEMLLFPLIGIGYIVGAFIHSRFPEFSHYSKLPKILGIILGVLALITFVVASIRLVLIMDSVFQVTFPNIAGIGYYTALVGTGISVFGSAIPGR